MVMLCHGHGHVSKILWSISVLPANLLFTYLLCCWDTHNFNPIITQYIIKKHNTPLMITYIVSNRRGMNALLIKLSLFILKEYWKYIDITNLIVSCCSRFWITLQRVEKNISFNTNNFDVDIYGLEFSLLRIIRCKGILFDSCKDTYAFWMNNIIYNATCHNNDIIRNAIDDIIKLHICGCTYIYIYMLLLCIIESTF